MGEVKGFLKYDRKNLKKQPVKERVKHYREFTLPLSEEELKQQGARCMDCGVPFCHYGCPIDNIIPDFNDLIYQWRWQDAMQLLLSTNPFPEFTGRVCPAPCEAACVLAINQPAVTICNIELAIIERAYKEGWMKPNPPKFRTGKKVAVVGSGPAGLTAAYLLNNLGHSVTVYEKNEVIGGLLALGIPDFKLEYAVIKRRIKIMEQEGIIFKTNINIGVDVAVKKILNEFDAMVLCGGAEVPRDLPIPGRELIGIYQAMEILTQQNRRVGQRDIKSSVEILAKNKKVVVIGGGDTGADCVGTANRQGAKSVKQIEIMPEPPQEREVDNPWPFWPFIKRSSSSHEEGVEQYFCVKTKEFSGKNGKLKSLKCVIMEFGPKDSKTGSRPMRELEESEFELEADLVLLAMGFTGPLKQGVLTELELELDERGNVKTSEDKMTSFPGVFAAGDMATGQSLVVKTIAEGKRAAKGVDKFLREN